MAKPRKLEDFIALLQVARDAPTSEASLNSLQTVLGSKYGVAVAKAAELVGQAELRLLIPQLETAFYRFLVDGVELDPGCRAKRAIAEALYRLGSSNETLFLQGIRHVQLEPVWGGRQDTAPPLRNVSALALVQMHYPLVMVELADLLADVEPEARIGAARAIAYASHDQGVPLLRLRVKVGDTPPVLCECLIALLALSPETSLPLAKQFLERSAIDSPEAIAQAEAAALALGESRLPAAFELLTAWWQSLRSTQLRQSGLLAISTLRQSAAIQFLLVLVAEGNRQDATAALKALHIHQQDEALWQRVIQTVDQREDIRLQL